MSDKTFVYDGQEVVLTGRQAKRELPERSRRTPRRIDVVVEIKPADIENGSWTRWVKMTDLYEIIDTPVTADPAANESIDIPPGDPPPFVPLNEEVFRSPQPFPTGEPDIFRSPQPFDIPNGKKGGPYFIPSKTPSLPCERSDTPDELEDFNPDE